MAVWERKGKGGDSERELREEVNGVLKERFLG
jgi:hypothetical protein